MRSIVAVCLALLALLVQPAAADESYPTRPVTIVVPFPAGSGTDGVARKLAEGLRERLGQSFVVENKAGADGIIACRAVASAPADGYTLLVTTGSTHSANPNIYRQLPYDPLRDFTPVAGLTTGAFMLAVRPDFPANDLAGLLNVASAAKPPLSFASANMSSRAAGELLKSRAGIDLLHVPYRGSPQAVVDLMGGRVDLFFLDTASGIADERRRDFKVLAFTGGRRARMLPTIATMEEQGVPDYRVVAYSAIFGPAGLPPTVTTRLNDAVRVILASPDFVGFLDQTAAEALPTSPSDLQAFVVAETARWAEIVQTAKIEKK